ncbi:MAG: hypothetical protein DRI48_07450 [Chloroflexi bacterium]|nr:MAG: hypothetical protein DRI48_07450 [Chloroflexota bacterium]
MNVGTLVDVAGWTGAAALLLAYALVSTRKLEGDSALYQLLNLAGSALLIVNSFYYGAYPSAGVNVVWIGIAVYALVAGRSGTGASTT